MLERLRASTQHWLGRSIMAIIMGFIILSFVIWGIGDPFRGAGGDNVAKVGSADITLVAFRDAYQTQLQRLQRQSKRAITPAEARLYGLDRQVLSRLISEAALDQKASQLGLTISDQDIANSIVNDETFKGPLGSFDRERFNQLLRDNGLNEKSYVRDQRNADLRHQITDALTTGIEVPEIMLDAIHRFQAETRSVDYFTLPAAAAGDIPAPADSELEKYFANHAMAYRTQDLRKLIVLTLTPALLASAELPLIIDEEAQKRYDEVKDTRFISSEQRAVQQIVFPDAAEAEAAHQKLDQGMSFEALLAERKLTEKDVDLGLVTKDKLIDPAVAEAAFSLPEGKISEPVKAAFGSVLLRVTKIVPGEVKPFGEVKDAIMQELALAKAKAKIVSLHDQIEDQRTAGKSLTEAAKTAGSEPHTIESIDASGHDDKDALVPDLVDGPALLKAAFASDVGVDNETLSLKDGGYQWFEVLHVEPARQKTFAEVKPEVLVAFTDDERAKKLTAKAAELVEKINAGEPLEKVAASLAPTLGELEIKHANDINRAGGGLAENLVSQIFNVGVHGAGSALDPAGGRQVFEVMAVNIPPLDAKAPDFVALAAEIKTGLNEDVVAQFIGKLQSELGMKFNAQAFAAATNAN
jgi:peptidyl-prolyl cis-trans isomerase D